VEKRIISIILMSLIVGLAVGYGTGYLGTDVIVLRQSIQQLQAQVENFQDQNNDLQNQLNDATTEVSQLNSELSQKNSQIISLGIYLSNLQQQLENKNDEIQTLQSQVDSLEDQLDTQILGVYFSPDGGCEDQVLYWINRANETIHILIYSFTLDTISDELVVANQRGIEVKVLFERQQISQYSEYQKLKNAGIPVRNDTNSDLMHDKVMIIDGTIVLTGSFNYSAAAEEDNNENLLVIKSATIAAEYEEEFTEIWNQGV
jgi:phosphatidylserine/phosphatidylglycerophosphate/cardiolipin synthase-like enzyme